MERKRDREGETNRQTYCILGSVWLKKIYDRVKHPTYSTSISKSTTKTLTVTQLGVNIEGVAISTSVRVAHLLAIIVTLVAVIGTASSPYKRTYFSYVYPYF